MIPSPGTEYYNFGRIDSTSAFFCQGMKADMLEMLMWARVNREKRQQEQ